MFSAIAVSLSCRIESNLFVQNKTPAFGKFAKLCAQKHKLVSEIVSLNTASSSLTIPKSNTCLFVFHLRIDLAAKLNPRPLFTTIEALKSQTRLINPRNPSQTPTRTKTNRREKKNLQVQRSIGIQGNIGVVAATPLEFTRDRAYRVNL